MDRILGNRAVLVHPELVTWADIGPRANDEHRSASLSDT
jgi:hypothetical protein